MSYRAISLSSKSWNHFFARIISLLVKSSSLSFIFFPGSVAANVLIYCVQEMPYIASWIVQKIKLMSNYSQTFKTIMETICK